MLDDVIDSPGLISEAIGATIGTLSQNREFDLVTYTKYTNTADGFVYWLKTATVQKIRGSLHNRAVQENEQDHTNSRNTIILTTQDQIKGFDETNPQSAYFITVALDDPAIVDGGPMVIGFNSADNYYQEAGAYHYMGQAVFPNFRRFIIDDPLTFLASIIPTNSLPILLTQIAASGVATYAAWAVPPNLTTPYVSVAIQTSQTINSVPFYDSSLTTKFINQFRIDEIELVAYNMGAANMQELISHIYDASMRPGLYGITKLPQVQDVPAVQSEYGIRADKKSVKMSVSYWLSTASTVVRKTITQANFSLEVL
jgi:hypothetical protein